MATNYVISRNKKNSVVSIFRCPDITRLYTLSEPSVNGIPLYVLEITDHPGKHELSKCVVIDHNYA